MPKVEVFNKKVVIKKAMDVFHEKGYNATSMQDLVNATGLNRSSIYNSFECKLNMYLECLKAYQDKYFKKNKAVLSNSNNPLETIQLILDMYLKESLNPEDNKGCFIVNCKSEMANQEKSITSFLLKNQEETLCFFENTIKKGQDQGLINNNETARNYAIYIYSSIQGFRMTSILISNKNQLLSIVKTIMKTII